MIRVDVDDSNLRKGLNELCSKLNGGGRRKLMEKVGKIAAQGMKRNFVYGGINPEKWKENSAATKANKPAGHGVLVDAGNLQKIGFEVVEDGVLVGSDKDYGKYHLPPEKSGHPSKNIMPVRDWLGLDKAGYDRIEKEIVADLADL